MVVNNSLNGLLKAPIFITAHHCVLHQQNQNMGTFMLSMKLQGKEAHIPKFQDYTFTCELHSWHRKVDLGNVSMFEKMYQ